MTLVGSDSDSETLTGSYTQEKKTRTKVVGEHDWQEATTTDSRAVCPALNAMANHNYLYATLSFLPPLPFCADANTAPLLQE